VGEGEKFTEKERKRKRNNEREKDGKEEE